MDTAGKLRFKWEGNEDLDLGSVTDINEVFTKSVSTVPLTSMPMENAIAIETGSSLNYNFKFTRVQPDTEDQNTNSEWYVLWTLALNRWQMKTDGFRFYYTPDSSSESNENPYLPEVSYNGYVKKLSRQYSAGNPLAITGNLDFHVGTMYSGASDSTPISDLDIDPKNFAITISDPDDPSQLYVLLDGSSTLNCVKSYRMVAGINNPFEYAIINISHEKLHTYYPDLVDKILPGKNKIQINAVGLSSAMTVVKSKLKNNVMTITAYCNAEAIKSRVISNDSSFPAIDWIYNILTLPEFGTGSSGLFDRSHIITNIDPNTSTGDNLSFISGTSVWYILQVCATILKAKVFFAGGNAYVVNCVSGLGHDGLNITWNANIDLYPRNKDSPENPDLYRLYASVVGDVTQGDEGMDAMINALPIRCKHEYIPDSGGPSEPTPEPEPPAEGDPVPPAPEPVKEYSVKEELYKDQESIDHYGVEQTGEVINLDDLDIGQAHDFARGFFAYRREPQISCKFTVKEYRKVSTTPESTSTIHTVWTPAFSPVVGALAIINRPDNFTISNRSEITKSAAISKLLLTSYERQYPEGRTEYTFGVIANIDLANSTSKIVSAQSSYAK